MWRFIVVTFAFMAFAFYQLSGGADYSPREGSRQHAAAMTHGTPAQKDTDQTTAALAPANPARAAQGAQVVLASTGDQGRAPVEGAGKRVRLTVGGETAGTSAATTAGVATVAANPEKIARLLEAASMTAEPNSDPEPAQAVAVAVASAQGGPDIRKVISQRVNLREGPGTNYGVAGKLTRGMEVEITGSNGDGWVELEVLETGQTGWMADFLLSPKS